MKEKMKKIFSVLVCMALTIALSGCVKYELKMGVKEDKSMDFDLIYAIDGSYMDSLNTGDDEDDDLLTTDDEDDEEESDISVSEYEFLKKKGYSVEEYTNTDDGHKYAGIRIKKTFKSIDDITKESEKTVDINKIFQDEDFDDSQFFSKKGNVYSASFIFDMSQEGSTDTSGSADSMFDMTYTVTLPTKAKENNATTVSEDGKTLTWKLKYGKKNEVKYSFEMGESKEDKKDSEDKKEKDDDKLTLYIIIGCSAGAVVIVLIILIIVLGKKNKPAQTYNADLNNNIQNPVNNDVQNPVNNDNSNNNIQQ